MSQCDRKASPSAAGRRARPGTDGGRRGGSGREALGGSTPLGLQPAAHAPSAWPHSVRFCARPGFFNCLGSFFCNWRFECGRRGLQGMHSRPLQTTYCISSTSSPQLALSVSFSQRRTGPNRDMPQPELARPTRAGEKRAHDSSALKPIGGASASERKTSKGTSTLGGVVHV